MSLLIRTHGGPRARAYSLRHHARRCIAPVHPSQVAPNAKKTLSCKLGRRMSKRASSSRQHDRQRKTARVDNADYVYDGGDVKLELQSNMSDSDVEVQ